MIDKGDLLPLKITDEDHLKTAAAETGFALKLRQGGSFRADENNVDIDVEMTDMSEAGVRYTAVSQAISKKLNVSARPWQGNHDNLSFQ